jgi:hypothetical protein
MECSKAEGDGAGHIPQRLQGNGDERIAADRLAAERRRSIITAAKSLLMNGVHRYGAARRAGAERLRKQVRGPV